VALARGDRRRRGHRGRDRGPCGRGDVAAECRPASVHARRRRGAGADHGGAGRGLKRCYDKALVAQPGLRGAVDLRFRVTLDGDVDTVTVVGVSADVASCISAVVRRLHFPAPADGGAVSVVYPLNLREAEALDPQAIQRAVVAKQADVDRCVAAAVGKIVLTVTAQPDGTSSVRVEGASDATSACVKAAIGELRFPPSAAGGSFSLTLGKRSAGPIEVAPERLRRLVGVQPDLDDDEARNIAATVAKKATATVRACMDAGGTPTEVSLVEPTHIPTLDQRIKVAVAAWRFEPYVDGGFALPVCATFTLEFAAAGDPLLAAARDAAARGAWAEALASWPRHRRRCARGRTIRRRCSSRGWRRAASVTVPRRRGS
jgi:hypothetical protein